ncbi:hypothetical protein T03_4446 [Trichinella britovi]|uniref:Uncharacterized protein n=2 Tax=Trichinella TaxID=6333 RepID=A0A0V1CLX3_TRIBR|nr:hypothetical protein T05_14958 [Trichinella murrelli]KRY50297.1 hypothetical protein T03_4446 [Trichinella britovi]KRZ85410.1 hypothetical protein T08_12381 [Trichinella sp. T8]
MFVVISYQVYPIRGTVFGWLTPHQLRGSFGDPIKDRKSNGTMLPLQPSVPNEPCLYQLFRQGIDRLCCFACTEVVGLLLLFLHTASALSNPGMEIFLQQHCAAAGDECGNRSESSSGGSVRSS